MDDKQLAPNTEGTGQAELDLRQRELELRRRKVELPIELAKLGLRGTLSGAIAGVVLVVILGCIGAFVEKAQITGTHLCILTGIICATVVFYGAFVFQRSFQLAVDKSKVTAGTTAPESGKGNAERTAAADRATADRWRCECRLELNGFGEKKQLLATGTFHLQRP
jgi:hypothetical protein